MVLGSTTEYVLRNADCPVFPATGERTAAAPVSGPGSGWTFDPAATSGPVVRPRLPPVSRRHLLRRLALARLAGRRFLIGSRGLLPAAAYLDAARAGGPGSASCRRSSGSMPATPPDTPASGSGGALSLAASFSGWRPPVHGAWRPSSTSRTRRRSQLPLLSVGQPAARMRSAGGPPPHRSAGALDPLAVPGVLFKLYWESGLAKWQSHLGDWQAAAAMTFYYRPRPCPPGRRGTRITCRSGGTTSRAARCGRRARPAGCSPSVRARRALAFAGRTERLSADQSGHRQLRLLRLLALALHLFLLADADLSRALARIPRWRPPAVRTAGGALASTAITGAVVVTTLYLWLSVVDGLLTLCRCRAPWSARWRVPRR